jgi:hypothetical protein
MAFTVTMEASNTADLIFDVSAVDADTLVAIDFTGATVNFVAQDEKGYAWLNGTLANGYVTRPSSTVFEFNFPDSLMQSMPKGTYKIGCVYQINGITSQLFTGTLSVYDGIATL